VALEGAGGARQPHRRVQKEARGAQALLQRHARHRRRVRIHGARAARHVAERALVAPERARRAHGRPVRVPRLARARERTRRVAGGRHARVRRARRARQRRLFEEEAFRTGTAGHLGGGFAGRTREEAGAQHRRKEPAARHCASTRRSHIVPARELVNLSPPVSGAQSLVFNRLVARVMEESSVNPYLVTAHHAMHSDAEFRHSQFALRTDGILPKSFKNHRSWWFGGKTKVDFPAFIKLSQIGWEQIFYDPETKEKIPHNWATGELRSPISANSNNIWKITLEFLKTESIDNDPASVVKQKKAFNQQQMLMYDNEELERDLDGDLNLQRLKQATDSLDKLTNHHKKTRTYLDERKSAEDRHEDFQIEEEALAQEERANQKIFDAEVAANVAQKNAKGLKDAQLAKDKLLALDEALAKRFQQEEDDRHSKKRHDAAVKRAVAGNSDDEGRQSSADDSEDGDAKPHNIQFSHRTQKSQDTDTPATKLQNALRNRLAKKELE